MLAIAAGSWSVAYESGTERSSDPILISPTPPLPARNSTARLTMSRTLAGTSFTPSPARGADSGVTVHPLSYVSVKLPISRAGEGHADPGTGERIVPDGSRVTTL